MSVDKKKQNCVRSQDVQFRQIDFGKNAIIDKCLPTVLLSRYQAIRLRIIIFYIFSFFSLIQLYMLLVV